MSGTRITQLHPQHATGRRYGSFSGKGVAAGPHPVGILTQLRPQRATGSRYGSFSGKGGAVAGPHPVGILTQLHPQRATGMRYGSFTGRGGVVPEPPVPTPDSSGFHIRPGYDRITQRARLHTFEDRDELRRLIARQGRARARRATLHSFTEADEWMLLQAHGVFHASLQGFKEADQINGLAARRGMPNRNLLAFFLRVIAEDN